MFTSGQAQNRQATAGHRQAMSMSIDFKQFEFENIQSMAVALECLHHFQYQKCTIHRKYPQANANQRAKKVGFGV